MKKKKIIIIGALGLILIGLGFYFYKVNQYTGTYKIKVNLIDDRSPDRLLVVYRNGKETTDYKYLRYKDNKEVVLCYSETPAVNQFEIKDIDELVIVLPNDKEVVAKIEKEK